MTTILRWIRNLFYLITGFGILVLVVMTVGAIFGETEFPHYLEWETVPAKGGGTIDHNVEGDYWGFLWQTLLCLVVATVVGTIINGIYSRMMIRKVYRETGGDVDAMMQRLDEEHGLGRFDY